MFCFLKDFLVEITLTYSFYKSIFYHLRFVRLAKINFFLEILMILTPGAQLLLWSIKHRAYQRIQRYFCVLLSRIYWQSSILSTRWDCSYSQDYTANALKLLPTALCLFLHNLTHLLGLVVPVRKRIVRVSQAVSKHSQYWLCDAHLAKPDTVWWHLQF